MKLKSINGFSLLELTISLLIFSWVFIALLKSQKDILIYQLSLLEKQQAIWLLQGSYEKLGFGLRQNEIFKSQSGTIFHFSYSTENLISIQWEGLDHQSHRFSI